MAAKNVIAMAAIRSCHGHGGGVFDKKGFKLG